MAKEPKPAAGAADEPRAPRTAKAEAPPSHVYLIEDCCEWRAGTVLRAHPDTLAKLTENGAKYRPATEFEISIGAAAAT